MSRPPLGLSVNVTDANGAVTRWASDARNPEDIPRGLSFRTQRMQGFADASVSLARRIDRDYVDVHLLDDIAFVGDDGSTAYEGRVASLPRSLDSTHSIGLQAQGWMAHTRDRKFTEIYVDRDLGRWGTPSAARTLALVSAGYGLPVGPTVAPDSAGTPAILTGLAGAWAAGGQPISELWYDAGPGNLIGALYYAWTKGANVNAADANWSWAVLLSDDDVATAYGSTGNLRAAGPGSGWLGPSGARRYALLQHNYVTGPAGTAGIDYSNQWRKLAVYGDHGIAAHGDDPGGLYASDMLRHLLRKCCPRLNLSGIKDTTYPIPHMVFRDRIAPYDAILDINKYHLWDFSVWENRTATYAPTDLTDYDWEIRHADPGVTITLQGDDVDELASGIVVQYTDISTGRVDVLTPDVYAELRDDSVENPYNSHGYPGWTEYPVSAPTTKDAALQIGRAALAEYNQPKMPGTISAQHYVRDRQGHMQPAWKVRAGDRVAITSSTSLSDRPRVIHETSYSHDTHQVTMAVDSTMKSLDAEIDRIATALTAAGLT